VVFTETRSLIPSNASHGFVRRADGTLITFDPPEAFQTQAFSINSRGTITGFYVDANNRQHGFVRRPGGTIVSFDAPESTATFPVSINDAGAITGSYIAANGRISSFVRDAHGKSTEIVLSTPFFRVSPVSTPLRSRMGSKDAPSVG
jgi:hypothetical protein